MTICPHFIEVLGKPPILNTFKGPKQPKQHRKTPELKQYSSATQCGLFCRQTIPLTIYAYRKGGGKPRDYMMTKGGSGYPPKMMTSFMNSPLPAANQQLPEPSAAEE